MQTRSVLQQQRGYKKAVLYTLQFIPTGKITTYKQLAEIFTTHIAKCIGTYKQMAPRQIGKILHKNQTPHNYPCYKVVRSNGTLADGYAFGGAPKQNQLLKREGIVVTKTTKGLYRIQNLKEYTIEFDPIFSALINLIVRYDEPGPWPWYKNQQHTKAEILISSILTQNTNWKNVDKALNNLKDLLKTTKITWNNVFKLLKIELIKLENAIYPAGYFRQKTKYLLNTLKFWKHHNLHRTPQHYADLQELRTKLLNIRGVGNETADTILLYVLDMPSFVIDAYTRRFVKQVLRRPKLAELPYYKIKTTFENSLYLYTNKTKLYQDYHALIVLWGKDTTKT